MSSSTSVHFKKIADAPATLVNDSGQPIKLSLGNAEGATLVVDEESGIFTLTVPDTEVEE